MPKRIGWEESIPREDHFQDVTIAGNISPGEQSRVLNDLVPSPTATHDLGTSALRWRNLYVNNLDWTGSVTATSIGPFYQVGTANGTAPAPDTAPTVATESATGGSIDTTTYYYVIAYYNKNGETTQSPVTTFACSSGSTNKVRICPADYQWIRGCYGMRVYVAAGAAGPFYRQTPSAFAIDTTGHYCTETGGATGSGDIILTSITLSGTTPQSTNGATIDPIQVAINSARDASVFSVRGYAGIVQLAGQDYAITTPIILGYDAPILQGVSTQLDISTAGGTAGFGTRITVSWSDANVGAVMVMGRHAVLKNLAIVCTGTTHALMTASGSTNMNGRYLEGVFLQVPSGATTVAPDYVYHVREAHDWYEHGVTKNGGRDVELISNSNVSNWHSWFGRLNCGSATNSSAVRHTAGYGDIDRAANFTGLKTAVAHYLHGMAVESAKGIVVDFNGGLFGWLDGTQNADGAHPAATEAIMKFGSDAYSSGSSLTGILIRDSVVFGDGNVNATIKLASGASDYGTNFGNHFDNCAIGGSSGTGTLVGMDFNSQTIKPLTVVGLCSGASLLSFDPLADATAAIVQNMNAGQQLTVVGGNGKDSAGGALLLYNEFRDKIMLAQSQDRSRRKTFWIDQTSPFDLKLLASDDSSVDMQWLASGGHMKMRGDLRINTANNPADVNFGTAAIAIGIPNTRKLASRNAANSADINLIGLNSGNAIEISQASTNINLLGAVANYNNIATVAGGIPAEYATVDLTAQGAAISATTLYAVPSTGAGTYRVSFVAKLTRAATTSSVLGGTNGFQLTYTDADDSVVVTTPAAITYNSNTTNLALNTTQAVYSGVIVVRAKASTNIQYALDYTSSGATTMQFALHIICEKM